MLSYSVLKGEGTYIMQPENTPPLGQQPATPPTNEQAQTPTSPNPGVILPAGSAQSRQGFDSIDRAKQQKKVPLLYLSAIASYIALALSLLTANEAALHSYVGVLAGGFAGLAGYRMGNKKLATFAYIAAGINAVILVITDFIL
jgi:hypothetical protein